MIKILSTSIPHLNKLRCLKLQINAKEIQESLIQSSYHVRIIKCRLLMHFIPEILASPISGEDYNDIYVIANTDFILNNEIKKKLNAVNIKYSDPLEIELTEKIYETCLRYTILYKVSPDWNKVDKYLLQGKYFLSSLAGPKTAIQMNIDLTADSRTRLTLSQTNVKVLPVSLEHFSLSEKILKNFTNNDNGFIVVNGTGLRTWVFVLPSLKKGRVISISKRIPQTSCFNNYQQLRKHWKNMYGYRLPETDDELIYYQIYFPGFGDNVYTYPDCCVKSSKLEYLNSNNSEDMLRLFIKDLKEKIPKILATEFNLQESPPEQIYIDSQKGTEVSRILKRKNIEFGTGSTSLNYIFPFSTSRRATDSQRRALSTISDNSGSGEARRNLIRDSCLYNVLTMKSFRPLFENNRLVERPKTMIMNSNSCETEQILDKLLLSKNKAKVETICSSKFIKANESNCENEREEVEVKSPYFKDIENLSKDDEKRATPGQKLRLHRLNLNAKQITSLGKKRSDVTFKTKDIASYFKEKKILKVSQVSQFEHTNKNFTPKLIQTRLDIKESGKVDIIN